MASNMSCIGITARDPQDFGRRMSLRLERSEPAGKWGAHELRVWSDESGASVSFVLSEDDVECATPGFRARSRLQARATRFVSDPDCRFCDPLLVEIVDAEGEPFYPLATQLDDLLLTRERVSEGALLELSLCAFARGIETWTDEAAFFTAQADEEVKFAAESLIPSGPECHTVSSAPERPRRRAGILPVRSWHGERSQGSRQHGAVRRDTRCPPGGRRAHTPTAGKASGRDAHGSGDGAGSGAGGRAARG
ncbi:MAG TPA: hypothetical protein VEU33_20100 [Archangium sp.]|nr:hypothetical protein [Archangium sp.]